MIEYMKRHERYINEMLEKKLPAEKLRELFEYHDKQIQWMQHERMAHLITMLFVCLFTLLTIGFAVIYPSIAAICLCALLIILTLAYVIHYYRLENGVQSWYALSNEIKSLLHRD